eukprot:711178_1
MSHRILDNKSDAKCIESFIPGTHVDLNNISIGTQIYYLYKEENNNNILSWYWGVLISINKQRENGEYFHILHDDEDPWIDLTKDKNDWKQIPTKHSLYDNQFDTKDYLSMKNKKQIIEKTAKKTSNKRIKSLNEIDNNSDHNYEISTRGFIEMINNKRITCTIIQSIQLYEAVKLQRMDVNNPYILWVRKQDIKQVLPNHKLYGQRISFELAGQTNRYKIIETNKEKKFIQVYWKSDINNTWIHIKNFNNITYSNKENKQQNKQQDININDGISYKSLKLSKKKHRNKHKKTKSNTSLSLSCASRSDRISDIARYQQLPRLCNNNNNNNNNNN